MILTSQQIEQLICEKVEQCYLIATDYFSQEFARPKIRFNQRGKVAGSARLQINELRFNPILLQDNLQAFIEDVVPHEVCHLLTYTLYGRVRPHGKEWQSMMTKLYGLSPQTHHQMDVTKVRGKTFAYRCACGPVELSVRRHNKVLRGQQKYICKRCKNILNAV